MAHLGGFSEDALKLFQEAASEQGFDFSEMGDTYDFTRCVRPDGTSYGTSGKCRKGKEAGAEESKTKGQKISEAATKRNVNKALGKMQRAALPTTKKPKALKKPPTSGELAKETEKAVMGPKRKLATSAETKPAWQEAEKVVKSAKEEFKRVKAETKGDKSPEARKRLLQAGIALDRAERAAEKASNKYFAAVKRESRAAMTPEQRKEEREWNKTKKMYG